MKNKFFVIGLSVVLYIMSLAAFSLLLNSDSDNMIVKYIQMSNEQLENNKDEEDIRVQMAIYYMTEFNKGNILKSITGNGIPSGDSTYGKKRDYLMDTKLFFVEDVGFVQIFVWFGLIGLFMYAKLLVKAIKIPRKQNYTYGFLYVVYLFAILPTNCSLTTQPIFLAIALYVLYLGEKDSYKTL